MTKEGIKSWILWLQVRQSDWLCTSSVPSYSISVIKLPFHTTLLDFYHQKYHILYDLISKVKYGRGRGVVPENWIKLMVVCPPPLSTHFLGSIKIIEVNCVYIFFFACQDFSDESTPSPPHFQKRGACIGEVAS